MLRLGRRRQSLPPIASIRLRGSMRLTVPDDRRTVDGGTGTMDIFAAVVFFLLGAALVVYVASPTTARGLDNFGSGFVPYRSAGWPHGVQEEEPVQVIDSAYVRKVVSQMLSRSPFLEVVGTARDGARGARAGRPSCNPDVVTCDLNMPAIGRRRRSSASRWRAGRCRSSSSASPASRASRCWRRSTPARSTSCRSRPRSPPRSCSTSPTSWSRRSRRRRGAPRVRRGAGRAGAAPLPRRRRHPAARSTSSSSASRPAGRRRSRCVIPRLPADFPVPVAIVLHMPVGYTELYARKLDELSALTVVEAQRAMRSSAGHRVSSPRRAAT